MGLPMGKGVAGRLAVVGLCAVMAGTALWVFTRAARTRDTVGASLSLEAPLQPATETGSLTIGEAMPDLQLRSLAGEAVWLHDLLNHEGPTVVTFISLGCPPCFQELRTLRDNRALLMRLGARVICVSGETPTLRSGTAPGSSGWRGSDAGAATAGG
ncbi:MAG: peroxiredoxin family protein [Acetobacteraceae bacterium]|nr:peroxiredoxin family protein [Acetobacteraceae bacterium]